MNDYASRLTLALLQAGLPVQGCDSSGQIRLDAHADAAQRQTAQALADRLDKQPRQGRTWADLYADVRKLPSQERDNLLLAALAACLQTRPDLPALLGLSLPTDEPAARTQP